MRIARLILLGALASAVSVSAHAATSAPKLHAPGAATLTDADATATKKAKKPKAKKVKKPKKDS